MILVGSEESATGFAQSAQLLLQGGNILDVIEFGLRAAEVDGLSSAGLHGQPNAIGRVELDAGLMDGTSSKSGAVGALRACAHPISVARKVLERSPHELLVGEGAYLFAREMGVEVDDRWPGSPDVTGDILAASQKKLDEAGSHDTVIYVGVDRHGHAAAGASTSGLAGKYPGRVGDSAIIGAGFYAVSQVGAAGCTGIGEMTMRSGAARSVVERLKCGFGVEEAVKLCLSDLASLHGGLVGGVTILAVDAQCNHFVGTLRRQSSRFFMVKSSDPETGARDIQFHM